MDAIIALGREFAAEVKMVRRKDAEEIINMLNEGEVAKIFCNGKIRNFAGAGVLTIIRGLGKGENAIWFYEINDTRWEKGRRLPFGRTFSGIITRDEAVELLAAFGRAKSKAMFARIQQSSRVVKTQNGVS